MSKNISGPEVCLYTSLIQIMRKSSSPSNIWLNKKWMTRLRDGLHEKIAKYWGCVKVCLILL